MICRQQSLLADEGHRDRNDATLADTVRALAEIPLRWQPGTRWEYSVATDVLGRLLEVLADQPLDRVLQERFSPM